MSRNIVILIVAVVAIIGGGLLFRGFVDDGALTAGAGPRLEPASFSEERQARAQATLARVHQTDRETIERALNAQKVVLKEIGTEPVRRRKLCISGILENDAEIEEVDPASGLATEVVSSCSVVVGWMEKLGGVIGGDPTAKKIDRIAKLWGRYFGDPAEITRRMTIEVETAVLEFRARRHGFVSGLGGRDWTDLQSRAPAASATFLGAVEPYSDAELKALRQAGRAPKVALKSEPPDLIARKIVNAAFEEAASTMGLDLELAPAPAKSAEQRGVGADVWVAAIARAVLAATPKDATATAAAELEATIREAVAIAQRDAEAALRRRLAERLDAQQAAERAVFETAVEPQDGATQAVN